MDIKMDIENGKKRILTKMRDHSHHQNFKIIVKEKITEIVQSQPDDASYEEILRELAFEHMVQRGLKDVREGRVVSNMVMEQQIRSWSK